MARRKHPFKQRFRPSAQCTAPWSILSALALLLLSSAPVAFAVEPIKTETAHSQPVGTVDNAPRPMEPPVRARSNETPPQPIDVENTHTTEIPPTFPKRIVMDQFICSRDVVYQGKRMPCDSNLEPDGEMLRPILMKSPAAVKELNIYQQRRKKLGNLTYVGAGGLAIFLAGQLAPRFGAEKEEADRIQKWTTPIGLGVIGMSFATGWILLQFNEEHLRNAVNIYNKENPKDQIQMQFSATFQF